jgi:TonB family protein
VADAPATVLIATGSLRVVTTPAGATITVDGSVRGTSPLRLRNLALAEHTVAISLQGFEREEQQVRLTGRRAAQVVELTLRPVRVAPTTGSISVTTEPAGATITVDGAPLGGSGSIDVPAGRHTVRAVLDGHEPASQEVEIEAGTTAQVSLTLKEIVVAPTGPLDLARVEIKPRQIAGGSAPGYPRAARAMKISGFIVASWIVDENGAVTGVTIDEASSKIFESEVLHWLDGVRYVPGRQAGQPVKVRMQRRFTFEYSREH